MSRLEWTSSTEAIRTYTLMAHGAIKRELKGGCGDGGGGARVPRMQMRALARFLGTYVNVAPKLVLVAWGCGGRCHQACDRHQHLKHGAAVELHRMQCLCLPPSSSLEPILIGSPLIRSETVTLPVG